MRLHCSEITGDSIASDVIKSASSGLKDIEVDAPFLTATGGFAQDLFREIMSRALAAFDQE